MKFHTTKLTTATAAALLTTTLALAAGGTPSNAQSPTANAVEAVPVPAATSKLNGPIARSEMLSRGRFWTDKNLAYNQKGWAKDPQGRKYRMDCSGFVSMAWHLDKSLTTFTLPQVSTPIQWKDLAPGDILLTQAHVVMFGGWANKAHTSMVLLQEGNPRSGATERTERVSSYKNFQPRRYNKVTSDSQQPTPTPKPPTPAPISNTGDELLFYKGSTGNYSYYGVDAQGAIGSPVKVAQYSPNWSAITNIELDGDPQSELMFFNRSNGNFAYYNVQANGNLGSLINSSGMSHSTYGQNWTSVTSIDINGDGHDEVLFYDAASGAYAYYAVNAQGALTNEILSTQTAKPYAKGWTSVTNLDLNGDGHDEVLFYNGATGAFSYYNVNPDGQLGAVILSSYQNGHPYSSGWTAIIDIDLDGDHQSELLFYNAYTGMYSYYGVNPQAQLGTPIRTSSATGHPYSMGWSTLVNVNLDGK